MIIAASSGIILFFWKICKLPRANQILALAVASILLPPMSYDYTLTHLVYSVGRPCAARGLDTKKNAITWIGSRFYLHGYPDAPESGLILLGVRVAGQLKAFVLLALFVISIAYPFPESESADDQQSIDPHARMAMG